MTSRFDEIDWPVRTDRLLLRRATPADAEATLAIRTKPGVSDWLTIAPDGGDVSDSPLLDPERLAKTVVIELDGDVVGEASITLQDAWAQSEVQDLAKGVEAELGWVLDPTHGGRGYATEAVRALLGVCFDGLGLRRVVAHCFADNTASWRLMERIGMRREVHAVADSLHRSGAWLDGFSYALLADEWRTMLGE